AVNVTEARIIVELGILPLAVERATDDDIAALFEMVDEAEHALEAGAYDVEMSAAFHIRVAQCTHNQAIRDRDLAAAREIATTHLDRTARRVSGDEEPDAE